MAQPTNTANVRVNHPALDLHNSFKYHPPYGDQPERYGILRRKGLQFSETILLLCPESAERTLAIRKAQEAVMWANASIAINEAEQSEQDTHAEAAGDQ